MNCSGSNVWTGTPGGDKHGESGAEPASPSSKPQLQSPNHRDSTRMSTTVAVHMEPEVLPCLPCVRNSLSETSPTADARAKTPLTSSPRRKVYRSAIASNGRAPEDAATLFVDSRSPSSKQSPSSPLGLSRGAEAPQSPTGASPLSLTGGISPVAGDGQPCGSRSPPSPKEPLLLMVGSPTRRESTSTRRRASESSRLSGQTIQRRMTADRVNLIVDSKPMTPKMAEHDPRSPTLMPEEWKQELLQKMDDRNDTADRPEKVDSPSAKPPDSPASGGRRQSTPLWRANSRGPSSPSSRPTSACINKKCTKLTTVPGPLSPQSPASSHNDMHALERDAGYGSPLNVRAYTAALSSPASAARAQFTAQPSLSRTNSRPMTAGGSPKHASDFLPAISPMSSPSARASHSGQLCVSGDKVQSQTHCGASHKMGKKDTGGSTNAPPTATRSEKVASEQVRTITDQKGPELCVSGTNSTDKNIND